MKTGNKSGLKEIVTTRELAKVLGISPRRLQQLTYEENILPNIGQGKYELSITVQRYIAHLIRSDRQRNHRLKYKADEQKKEALQALSGKLEIVLKLDESLEVLLKSFL